MNIKSIIIGVVGTLFTIIVTSYVTYYFEKTDIVYNFTEPIKVKDNTFFKIIIKNNGRKKGNNLIIRFNQKIDDYNISSEKEFMTENQNDKTIIKIGSIIPEEEIDMNFLIKDKYTYLSSFSLENLVIESESAFVKYEDEYKDIYDFVKFLLIGLGLMIICLFPLLLIYVKYFESLEKSLLRYKESIMDEKRLSDDHKNILINKIDEIIKTIKKDN